MVALSFLTSTKTIDLDLFCSILRLISLARFLCTDSAAALLAEFFLLLERLLELFAETGTKFIAMQLLLEPIFALNIVSIRLEVNDRDTVLRWGGIFKRIFKASKFS